MSSRSFDNHIRDTRWENLLGKTVTELIRVMGDPFVVYRYHEEEVYLYDSQPEATFEIHDGLVVRCNDLADKRRTARVRPLGRIAAIARGESKIKGTLHDISTAGAAMLHHSDSLLPRGSDAMISFALPIDGIDCFMEIPSRVQDSRTIDGMRSTVFLFDLTDCLDKKRLIFRYVMVRKAQMELDLNDNLLWEARKRPELRISK